MKAKLVIESLADVFKGPTEEEIDFVLEEYSEAYQNIDKFIFRDYRQEFNEILDSETSEEVKIQSMREFLTFSADDRMLSYFPEGGNIKEFATYIIRNN